MKLPQLIAICAILAVSAPLFAAEKANLALNDGRVLKAARIVSITGDKVSIVHSEGIISVAADSVPLDILARAHMALQEAEAKRREEQDLVAQRIRGSEIRRSAEEQRRAEVARETALADATIDARVSIISVTKNGIVAKGWGVAGRPKSRHTVSLPEVFFVKMKPAGLVDDREVDVIMWPLGTYSYGTAANAHATVKSYTTDFEEFLRSEAPRALGILAESNRPGG